MWPVLRHEEILRLQQPTSATSTISNQEESRTTMRSAETQTELLECSSSSDEEEQHEGSSDDGEGAANTMEEDDGPLEVERNEVEDAEEDEYDVDSLDEESRLKTIKRLGCGNLFNFNKLELLNELSSGVADSSRNLCEHEVHVAIDDDLATTTGEGKRTTMAAVRTKSSVLGGVSDDSVGSCSSVIFIQESPEVIL